jgi:hypothetical protein
MLSYIPKIAKTAFPLIVVCRCRDAKILYALCIPNYATGEVDAAL